MAIILLKVGAKCGQWAIKISDVQTYINICFKEVLKLVSR